MVRPSLTNRDLTRGPSRRPLASQTRKARRKWVYFSPARWPIARQVTVQQCGTTTRFSKCERSVERRQVHLLRRELPVLR
ncbi:hypothetical protein WA026_018801 [Henosepilachna vigintioctopunctata]|uniref:Uncharacterized protein n=1 Tax=Henosepilachna vigintioctopunctata TaxID=420089 RepID=A0AAW1TMD6_9CUCU